MYTPRDYVEDDPVALARIIAARPFAVIVSAGPEGPVGTHLPFVLDGPAGPDGRLLAHMAKGNPQAQAFDGNTSALVVFSGAHAYVSPRWYANPRNVPTWNYEAVHVTGCPRLISDPAETRSCVARLATAVESGTATPWTLDSADADYIDGMLKGIVAFEISIQVIEGKRKMGQNRTPEDRQAAAKVLRQADDTMAQEVGRMMQRNIND
jgi:transcriptional regulator